MAARNRKRKSVGQPRHGSEGRYEPVPRIVVDNPLYSRAHEGASGNPKHIEAVVNRRHDIVVWLHSRKQIDDAQKMAGDRFLWLWERMESGAQAMDYGREHVDGGAAWPDVNVRALEAAKELDGLRAKVGTFPYSLLQRAICRRDTIGQIAAAMYSRENARDRDYIGRLLRETLDLAAAHWGLTTRRVAM